MQRITPFLWFNGQAEDAMKFYVSIFKNSKVVAVTRYGPEGPGPQGSVMTAAFKLDGQDFVALNGGPEFSISPAISFVVNCETQDEIDEYWDRLLEGGKPMQCGWLTDKYGVSWQVVPAVLWEMMNSKEPERSSRVMQALMQMVKLDIAKLKQAYGE